VVAHPAARGARRAEHPRVDLAAASVLARSGSRQGTGRMPRAARSLITCA
jgi:hypothetical protein